MKRGIDGVVAYHEKTKHSFFAFALGPGRLDWATQPDPFRRYSGAELIPLDRVPLGESPTFDAAMSGVVAPPAPLDRAAISRLFFDSLALSAWKSYAGSTWALRVNPSSGNLHPTEGYLVCGPVAGLCEAPAVFHYAPREHALERRAIVPDDVWSVVAEALPAGAVLVGLSSVFWREAWKYGERAYRYCQHDVGHAIAAIALSAAGLGWQATLVDGLSTDQVGALLGIEQTGDAEPEHPDCVLAIFPSAIDPRPVALPDGAAAAFRRVEWVGSPNALSPSHVDWPIIDAVAEEARKPSGAGHLGFAFPADVEWIAERDIALRPLVHARRSAVAMDGRTTISRDAFYRMLAGTLATVGSPLAAFGWEPTIDLGLFVHRVEGVEPGLYALVRNPRRRDVLRAATDPSFEWERPESCPPWLDLFRLAVGDAREVAEQVSCRQEIAGDGCFSLGMLAEFEPSLVARGAWFYPRLFWETGAIGQALYLEAEAEGVRATGIGCFFDDPVHDVFGLDGRQFQSLYHFTIGGAVDDPRLTTLPAYPGPRER
jgi:SagB-type dehydrogenase family enzyme